jgi:hypothetical protein
MQKKLAVPFAVMHDGWLGTTLFFGHNSFIFAASKIIYLDLHVLTLFS